MTYLENIPAVVKLLAAFVFIVFLIRKKISLGNAFLSGSVLLGFFFSFPLPAILKSMVMAVTYPKTLLLAIIISLILMLSNCMEKTGGMERLLITFRGLIKNPKLNIIIFPGLIGLLPMPGGAVFSAPMVKEIGSALKISPSRLSLINYWFRHIWEYWWPLYPGVLLIPILTGIQLTSFMLHMFPLSILAVFTGFVLLLNTLQFDRSEDSENHIRPDIRPFLREMLPVLIVIIPGILAGILLSRVFPDLAIAKEAGLVAALLVAVLWVIYDGKLSWPVVSKTVLNPKLLNIVYMILAILIFRGILEDSNAVADVAAEMIKMKIPLVLVVALLPFIVGFVTGITIAYVGSAFPILIPLISSYGPASDMFSFYIMLAMICGFSGVMLSPVHLCFMLTNEYFTIKMSSVYNKLVWLNVFLITSGAIYLLLVIKVLGV